MVHLTKDSVLVVSAFSQHGLKRGLNIDKTEFGRISNSCQAKIFIVLNNALADSLFKKCSIWKDELATLNFRWIRRQKMVDKPVELLSLNRRLVCIDPGFNWIYQCIHFFDGLVFELEIASWTVSSAEETAFSTVHLVQFVTVQIVRCICHWFKTWHSCCSFRIMNGTFFNTWYWKACHLLATRFSICVVFSLGGDGWAFTLIQHDAIVRCNYLNFLN